MADAYTQISSVPTLVQTAYDKLIESQNRLMPLLRNLPDKHPADITSAGSSVTLQKYSDLPLGSSELTELVDPDATALPATTSLNIAFREFGRVVFRSKRLDLTSLAKIDPIIVDVLARDMAVSLDDEVGTILYGGTNVARPSNRATTGAVTTTDVIKSQDVRVMIAGLRTRAANPRRGDLYAAYVHPNVALDLRTETGANAWRDDHKYAAPDLFWAGETGVYEGAFWVESARMKKASDGAASASVYRTVFCGTQALAEVVWEEPHSVIGDIPVDKLQRHRPFGWYGALNWARYREENLVRYESSATIQ